MRVKILAWFKRGDFSTPYTPASGGHCGTICYPLLNHAKISNILLCFIIICFSVNIAKGENLGVNKHASKEKISHPSTPRQQGTLRSDLLPSFEVCHANAKKYFKLGLFYKGLFNTTINTQSNYYDAILFLNDNKKRVYQLTREKTKFFSPAEISDIRYCRDVCYYHQGKIKKPNKRGKLTVKFYDSGILKSKSQQYFSLAIENYQRAIALRNDDSLSCQLGITQLMSRRLNDATATLTPLINSNNHGVKAMALINLGVAYYLKGSKEQAERYWDRVRDTYNNNPGVMTELGYTYSRLGIRLNESVVLCIERPGIFSYYSGMVHFKRGVLENKIDDIYDAARLLEQGCGHPTDYHPNIHNSIFFLDLNNAYYCKRSFWQSIQVLTWLLGHYPEVGQSLSVDRGMANLWKILTFFPEFKINWVDIWY